MNDLVHLFFIGKSGRPQFGNGRIRAILRLFKKKYY